MEDRRSSPEPFWQDFEEKELNLREYFLVIVKRRWMILIIGLFIVTLAAVYSFPSNPSYKAGVNGSNRGTDQSGRRSSDAVMAGVVGQSH